MISNDFFIAETNGFIMNAGIVGFIRLLEHCGAEKGKDYLYNEYQLKVKKDYLLQLDLSQAYIDTAIKLFYNNTHYARIKDSLQSSETYRFELIKSDELSKAREKKIHEDVSSMMKQLDILLKTKSLANACQTSLKEGEIEEDILELIRQVKKIKNLKEKVEQLAIINRILDTPELKESLCLVGVSLRVLSAFWLNKAFIKNSQGNVVILSDKNMKELLEKDIIIPLKNQIEETTYSDKVCCECGCRIPKKIKPNSLSFMNDMVDDIAKKPSAFWNFDKNNALLCPHCTFLYILMPLAFKPLGSQLIFINTSTTIQSLIGANPILSTIKEENNLTYTHFVETYIRYSERQLGNVQVISRTTGKGSQRYSLDVISYQSLRIINCVKNRLNSLSKCQTFKLSSGDYWSVSEEVINKLVRNEQLYLTLHKLFKLSMVTEYETSSIIQLRLVGEIQKIKRIEQLGGVNEMKSIQLENAIKCAQEDGRKIGNHFKAINKDTNGVIYRLLNALQTNNQYEFLNTVLRLHTSYNVNLSIEFIQLLNDSDCFKDMGYAYLLGLKSVTNQKQEQEVDNNEK